MTRQQLRAVERRIDAFVANPVLHLRVGDARRVQKFAADLRPLGPLPLHYDRQRDQLYLTLPAPFTYRQLYIDGAPITRDGWRVVTLELEALGVDIRKVGEEMH